MMITRSELLDVVYRFYPRGMLRIARIHVPPNEPVYDDTEEHRRLMEAANRGRAEYPTWEAMICRLGDRYRLQNESLKLLAGWVGPAYSARIYRLKDLEPIPSLSSRASLSFHVSLLGPYYGIHDKGEPDEKPAAIAEEIKATYPGYQPIPPELGNEVVPDVAMDGASFGEVTIYTCLFSNVWTWVDPVSPSPERPPSTRPSSGAGGRCELGGAPSAAAQAPLHHGDERMKRARSELLDIVYRFYPRGMLRIARIHIPPNEPVYDDTEEHRRLMEAADRGRAEYPAWKAMTRRLGDRYSLQNESLHLLSGGADPTYSTAYSARIWLVDQTALSFHVSLLGPYYGIHLPGIPEEEPVAREIAREIEATYPGYQPIPPELGNEVLPDVLVFGTSFGEATIYTCLFSNVWTWVDPVSPSGVTKGARPEDPSTPARRALSMARK